MRLKSQLKKEYKGGLVLIDEFDATLFPAAQTNLVDLFYKLAGKSNLQIVFTTHSLDTLEHIIDKRQHNNNDTEVLYFTNVYGKLDLIVAPQMQRIRSDLNMATISPLPSPKINLYCEDAEASWFIKRLLGTQKTKHLNFCDATFGGDFLNELAKKKIPEFKDSIIVLDGDKNINRAEPNVLILPGSANPENVFRSLLQGLPSDDSFWQNDFRYTKQVFEKSLSQITSGHYENRVKMKAWFIDQKKYWGRGGTQVYKCWLKSHQEQASEFCERFIQAYNGIAKRKSIPTI